MDEKFTLVGGTNHGVNISIRHGLSWLAVARRQSLTAEVPQGLTGKIDDEIYERREIHVGGGETLEVFALVGLSNSEILQFCQHGQ